MQPNHTNAITQRASTFIDILNLGGSQADLILINFKQNFQKKIF